MIMDYYTLQIKVSTMKSGKKSEISAGWFRFSVQMLKWLKLYIQEFYQVCYLEYRGSQIKPQILKHLNTKSVKYRILCLPRTMYTVEK